MTSLQWFQICGWSGAFCSPFWLKLPQPRCLYEKRSDIWCSAERAFSKYLENYYTSGRFHTRVTCVTYNSIKIGCTTLPPRALPSGCVTCSVFQVSRLFFYSRMFRMLSVYEICTKSAVMMTLWWMRNLCKIFCALCNVWVYMTGNPMYPFGCSNILACDGDEEKVLLNVQIGDKHTLSLREIDILWERESPRY